MFLQLTSDTQRETQPDTLGDIVPEGAAV
jgi:hypothetical protein